MKKLSSKNLISKDLDHLGIVAGICNEIGLIRCIDQIIPPDIRTKITIGECVQLMTINASGFVSRPMYLEAQFFNSKPIQRLIGRELHSEEITDDRLGRSLDALYEADCEKVFASIAAKAIAHFHVDTQFRHLDTTSMSVHGEYEEGIGLIEFGYSKDHNPGLKQFMISLMTSQDGDVPLLAKTIAGNTSDKTHFQDTLKELKNQWELANAPAYYVADSALYTKETIQTISKHMQWVSRVPANIKEAKKFINSYINSDMMPLENGYSYAEIENNYGNVNQRWVLIFSEQAFKRENATLQKLIDRMEVSLNKKLKRLLAQEYSCEKDAQKEIKRFEMALKYHCCKDVKIEKHIKYCKRGRPKKGDAQETVYSLSCELVRDEQKIDNILKSKGKFIVATNEMNKNRLSVSDILKNYKNQQSVERGFRFLKDPLFMTSSVFLKNEKRIVALGMIMCLCLLMYTLAQRLLRLQLEKHNATLPTQTGKESMKITIRWAFQMFEGVHILYHVTPSKIEEFPLNINKVRSKILHLLGPPYQKIYDAVA